MTTLKSLFSSLLEMLKEAGIYSINRVLPFFTWALFTILLICVIIYLIINHTTWSHFGELITLYLTMLGIVATWLTGNKFTNSKYNTPSGAPGKPLTNSQQGMVDKVVSVANGVVNRFNNTNTHDRPL